MIRRLLRDLLPGRGRGGEIHPYRPLRDTVFAVLSSGQYWPLECPAAGCDFTIEEDGWFWKCRDCGRRGGPFTGQRAAHEDWLAGPHRNRLPC